MLAIGTTLFYLGNDIGRFKDDYKYSTRPKVSSFTSCKKKNVDATVLQARKKPAEAIKVFIAFAERPLPDMVSFFQTNGVTVYPNTWINNTMLAATTADKICFVADLPGVTSISLGE